MFLKTLALTALLLTTGLSATAKTPPSKVDRERRRMLKQQREVEHKKWLDLTPAQEQRLKELTEAYQRQTVAIATRFQARIAELASEPYWEGSEEQVELLKQYHTRILPYVRDYLKEVDAVYNPEQRKKVADEYPQEQREKLTAKKQKAPELDVPYVSAQELADREKQLAAARAFLGVTPEQRREMARLQEGYFQQTRSMSARHREDLAPYQELLKPPAMVDSRRQPPKPLELVSLLDKHSREKQDCREAYAKSVTAVYTPEQQNKLFQYQEMVQKAWRHPIFCYSIL